MFIALALAVVYFIFSYTSIPQYVGIGLDPVDPRIGIPMRDAFRKWRLVPMKFPLQWYKKLPGAAPAKIPRLQHDFSVYHESEIHKDERKRRREAVKEAFEHSWNGYKQHAWLHDEVRPISGEPNDPFGAWGATLIDSLDTLWIMDMKKEFEAAVADLKKVDFTRSNLEQINVFESTIRYIGGLLGAYDLTNRKYNVLLHKAIELGEMLYHCFDTPNHMPVLRWNWQQCEAGEVEQEATEDAIVAELGSLTLEFTRLTQLTGDLKYYDAAARVLELFKREQSETHVPGLWPLRVNARTESLHDDNSFTLGGQADSLYEYLPKTYLLLQGSDDDYREMYEYAISSAKQYLAFEPLIPLQSDEDPSANTRPAKKINLDKDEDEEGDLAKRDLETTATERNGTEEAPRSLRKREYNFSPDYSNPILLGTAYSVWKTASVDLLPDAQHLACYAGGMVAIAARAFAPFHHHSETDEDMDFAERLVAGCVWSYRATPTKIGPEMYKLTPCRKGRAAITSGEERDWTGVEPGKCRWNRDAWMKAVRERHAPFMDPAKLAMDESEDADFWEHWVKKQGLKEGFVEIMDGKYQLRPETIESVFVLWRITGDPKYQDIAWEMFQSITRLTKTKIAYAGLPDVMVNPSLLALGKRDVELDEEAEEGDEEQQQDETKPKLEKRKKSKSTGPALDDRMESFWLGETLKYFYLIFCEPDVVSLDEYVFNTEAHPFRWRKGPPPKGKDNG